VDYQATDYESQFAALPGIGLGDRIWDLGCESGGTLASGGPTQDKRSTG